MPSDREKLSAAARSRADRTFPREVEIAGALTAVAAAGNRASPSEVVARALLEDHRGGAAKRGNRVAVAVRAVRA